MRRPIRSRTAALAALVLLLACNPELPSGRRGSHPDPTEDATPSVTLEPAAELAAVPPVLRIRIAGGADGIDPTQIALVRGEVGPAHLRQLAHHDVSHALAERIVPALSWVDDLDDGGKAAVLAPTGILERGETYSIAVGAPALDVEITVTEAEEPPVLARVWPPLGASGTAELAIWCGPVDLPPLDAAAELEPAGPVGALRDGAAPGLGHRCLRFEGDSSGVSGDGWVAPPAISIEDGAFASLDPRPIGTDAAIAPPSAAACEDDEIAIGLGCARVADDRIYGRGPGAALLWAIGGEGLDLVFATGPAEPFVIAPLEPLTHVALDVATIDGGGRVARGGFEAETGAPRPHLVLNEVLANPLGAEPAQEWVEIVNDGLVAADLEGVVLADGGGETVLPAASLPAGAYALVVNDSFLESDGVDVPPAAGTAIVRVPKLGKNGLSNAGEPLELRDPGGAVVSRFPATPKPKAGLSLSRVRPTAPDGLAASFVVDEHGPTPGAPNGAER